jgi:hypothetical protein
MNLGGHKRRITKAERDEILQVYLNNPDKGSQLAMSYGLSQIYAYKLAHERGLVPLAYQGGRNVLVQH